MERAIDRYPDTEIFGARCNRVGYSFQRLTFGQDENDSIKYHTKVADDLAITYSSGECNDAHTVAGFFMLFRKSYWNKVKFQDTIMDMRGNLFDYNFVLPAFKAGNKIRIIKGVYCWHSYRIMQENIKSKEHLKI
jgi:GT2 family glycosyltransferase